MDALDQQLLALLRTNARAPVATLAAKLKVSRGTVTNRIARLEDSGVITGYTVRLRPDSVPDEITAWMSITVEGNRTREVVSMLLGEPGITGLPMWPDDSFYLVSAGTLAATEIILTGNAIQIAAPLVPEFLF